MTSHELLPYASPFLADHDHADQALVNVVLASKMCLTDTVDMVFSQNDPGVLIGNLLTRIVPMADRPVPSIIGGSASVQMPRIYARRPITGVQYPEIIGNWFVYRFKNDTRDTFVFPRAMAANLYESVAVIISKAGIGPAIGDVLHIHTTPRSDERRGGGRCGLTGAATKLTRASLQARRVRLKRRFAALTSTLYLHHEVTSCGVMPSDVGASRGRFAALNCTRLARVPHTNTRG